jgi:epoxide hydrolase-like predicted phosphatase
MNPPLRAVIWDMGGVLLRTEDRRPRKQLAEHFGLTFQELDYLVFGNPAAQLSESGRVDAQERWAFIGRKLHLSPAELNAFQIQFWAGDRIDEILLQWIATLRPCFKTGLLSNAGPDASESIRARYPKLLDPFDDIIFSGEVGLVKPDPAIFHLILSRLQVQPDQAVFIDDFKQNILTAQMIGIHTVWFQSVDQARQDLLHMTGLS